ncbi:Transcription factor TGA6 [Capsicum baccatum]|uniref:Transcription factor TGA6 n=1 Tax=Capsicum baccatum TaxID=33114 RepID=A0A2G2X3A0_CAPBA|nr:Transcription factor TGA6 [Capsicum baccatum]
MARCAMCQNGIPKEHRDGSMVGSLSSSHLSIFKTRTIFHHVKCNLPISASKGKDDSSLKVRLFTGSLDTNSTKLNVKADIPSFKGRESGTGGKSQKPKAPEPLELRAEQEFLPLLILFYSLNMKIFYRFGGTLAFDAEYSRWLEEQNKHINELRNAVNSHASDPELRSIVNNVTAYFDKVFKVKGNAAKVDISMSCQGCGKPLPSGVLYGIVASAPRNFLSIRSEVSTQARNIQDQLSSLIEVGEKFGSNLVVEIYWVKKVEFIDGPSIEGQSTSTRTLNVMLRLLEDDKMDLVRVKVCCSRNANQPPHPADPLNEYILHAEFRAAFQALAQAVTTNIQGNRQDAVPPQQDGDLA